MVRVHCFNPRRLSAPPHIWKPIKYRSRFRYIFLLQQSKSTYIWKEKNVPVVICNISKSKTLMGLLHYKLMLFVVWNCLCGCRGILYIHFCTWTKKCKHNLSSIVYAKNWSKLLSKDKKRFYMLFSMQIAM